MKVFESVTRYDLKHDLVVSQTMENRPVPIFRHACKCPVCESVNTFAGKYNLPVKKCVHQDGVGYDRAFFTVLVNRTRLVRRMS